MVSLLVNGKQQIVDVDEDTPLLWALRDGLGLSGTKYGCGIGACGACTVHLDGMPVRSCQISVSEVGDSTIETIESLGTEASHPVQRAWVELQVPQCGYCQSGMIMAATALLRDTPQPTDEDIAAAMSNICRCGTYGRVRAAIYRAAAMMADQPEADQG